MNLDNASPLEIILFVLGAVLSVVNVSGILWAQGDVRLVNRRRRASPDFGLLLIIAKQQRRNEAIRLAKQLLYNSLWIALLFAPPPARESLQLIAIYTGLVLLAAQALLALATLWDRADNDRLKFQARKLWPVITRRLGRFGGKQDDADKTGNGSGAG